MKKSDGEAPATAKDVAHAKAETSKSSTLERAFGVTRAAPSIDGIVVLPLSNLLKVLLPPLLISSLPKRAIGFSFPRGKEGKVIGVSLLFATAAVSFLLDRTLGIFPALAIVWLMGGTGVVILFNSIGQGVAFVKQMCSTCRLRPIIEEHEKMHLDGEASEEEVWKAARTKYSYEGLGLGTDPMIHSFCPIAKRLKESP
ncbi:MAG TPA: hypothetical protein VGS04_06025 [Nitrososphaerales archaeon]|nr:hypothetical protein [Nitrososphaerales archaeon]